MVTSDPNSLPAMLTGETAEPIFEKDEEFSVFFFPIMHCSLDRSRWETLRGARWPVLMRIRQREQQNVGRWVGRAAQVEGWGNVRNSVVGLGGVGILSSVGGGLTSCKNNRQRVEALG